MDGEGTGAESEDRPVKGAHRVAYATGDDDSGGLACATLADGQRGSLKNTLRLANSRPQGTVCQNLMRVIAVIDQRVVVEKILRPFCVHPLQPLAFSLQPFYSCPTTKTS